MFVRQQTLAAVVQRRAIRHAKAPGGIGAAAMLRLPGACRGGEVIEDTKEVAIQVGGRELVQTPGLGLRSGDQSGVAGAPHAIELVDCRLALQVQPRRRRSGGVACLPVLLGRQEYPAVAFRDAREAEPLVTPVQRKAQAVLIVCRRGREIPHRYLGDGAGELRVHLRVLTDFGCRTPQLSCRLSAGGREMGDRAIPSAGDAPGCSRGRSAATTRRWMTAHQPSVAVAVAAELSAMVASEDV